MWNLPNFIKPAAGIYTPDEDKIFDATRWIVRGIIGFAAVGLIAVALWSYGEARKPPGITPTTALLKNFGLYGLVACAAAAAGALFGFLFAIPRTREAASVAAQSDDSTAARHAALVANTNLERVSDWLTTLLLGATLVQIGPIVTWFSKLGTCTTTDSCNPVTPVIVIFYSVLGFLGTYLITRLYLTYALERMLGIGISPSADDISKQFTDALIAGTKEKLDAALASFEREKSRSEIGENAKLNLLLARAAGRRIKLNGSLDASRKTKLQADLLAAAAKALADPPTKTAVQSDDAVKKDLQGQEQSVQQKIDDLLK